MKKREAPASKSENKNFIKLPNTVVQISLSLPSQLEWAVNSKYG